MKMKSTYHALNGRIEVVNKFLETYLRCFTLEKPHRWEKWIPLIEWWYNTTYHRATKMIQYEVVYG